MTEYEYVYGVAEVGEIYVKIGRSANVAKRMGECQVGNPRRLYALLTIPCEDSRSLEATLHARFADYRISGEWFRADNDAIAQWIADHSTPAEIDTAVKLASRTAPEPWTKNEEPEYVNLTVTVPAETWGDPPALAEYLAEVVADIGRKNSRKAGR